MEFLASAPVKCSAGPSLAPKEASFPSPLSRDEEAFWTRRYRDGRARLVSCALESPLLESCVLRVLGDELSSDVAGDEVVAESGSNEVLFGSQDANVVRSVRARVQRFAEERRELYRLRKGAPDTSESDALLAALSRRLRREIERLEPSEAFVELVLQQQARIASHGSRLRRQGRGGARQRRGTALYEYLFRCDLQAIDECQRRAVSARLQASQAQAKMLHHNQGLVRWVAKRMRGSDVPLEDLLQEGNLGLLSALEKFDPERGLKFSTYAMWWIRQAIQRAIWNKGAVVRVPVHRQELQRVVERQKRQLHERLRREPSLEELAGFTGIPLRRLAAAHAERHFTQSIDAPIGTGDERTLAGMLPASEASLPTECALESERRRALEGLMESLTLRERLVIRQRFGVGSRHARTFDEIAGSLGVSRERTRQIEKRAMEKLVRAAHKRGLQLDDF